MATRMCETESAESGEIGLCLICQNYALNSSTNETPSVPILTNDVYVYFILKRVFELPAEQIENYLRHCPFPEEWIKICENCGESYVNKCWQIFVQLLEIKRKFAGARKKLIDAARRCRNAEENVDEEDERLVFDITKETRRFIKRHNYQSSIEGIEVSSVEDLLANELLVARTKAKAITNSVGVGTSDLNNLVIKEEEVENQNEVPEDITVKVDPLYLHDHHDEEGDYKVEKEKGQDECSEVSNDEVSSEDEDWKPSDDSASHSTEDEEVNQMNDKTAQISTPVDTSTSTTRCKRKKKTKPGTYPCPECDKEFPTSGQLKNHIHWRHGKLNRGLSCPTCQKSFPSRKGCRAHIRRVHEHKGRFQCKECPKDFSEHDKFLCHMRTIHKETDFPKYSCPFAGCDKSFPYKHQLNVHEKSHKPPEFKCDICGELFRYKQGLQFHAMKHDLPQGMKPFRCELCPAQYSQKVKLVTHMKEKHCRTLDGASIGEVEVHSCHLCGKILATKASLQGHLKIMHEKSLSKVCCDLCGKLLKQTSLARHIEEVHTNKESKPYKCEDCGKAFTSKSTLQYVHKKVCPAVPNPNKIIKPFQCDECGKGFAVKNYLNLHKKVHDKKQSPTKQ